MSLRTQDNTIALYLTAKDYTNMLQFFCQITCNVVVCIKFIAGNATNTIRIKICCCCCADGHNVNISERHERCLSKTYVLFLRQVIIRLHSFIQVLYRAMPCCYTVLYIHISLSSAFREYVFLKHVYLSVLCVFVSVINAGVCVFGLEFPQMLINCCLTTSYKWGTSLSQSKYVYIYIYHKNELLWKRVR